MEFTQSQKQAIYIKDKQILLSAAAGSGKTAVLIEHIFNLLTDLNLNISLENLLVLSFTEKASREMKQRLLKKLNKELIDCQNEELEQKLSEQISKINFAQISTIHSFCSRLIRSNFHEIDIDPSFRLSDEENTTLLKQESILEVLEEKYEEKGESFVKVVEQFSQKVMDEKLITTILRIDEFIKSYPMPEKWLSNFKKFYDMDNEIDNNPFIVYLKKDILEKYSEMIETVSYVINMLEGEDTLIGSYEDATNKKENLEVIRHTVQNDFFDTYNVIKSIENTNLVISRKKDINKDIQTKAKDLYNSKVKKQRDRIEELYFYKPFNLIINEIKEQKEIIEELEDIVLKFRKVFADKKKEKNLLDFNDLEHFAIKILVGEDGKPTKVAKDYQKQFYEIMVDEFQDTSIVQETILNALINEELDYKNKYMVGDLKQCIYRFRNADPKIFINNYNEFSKEKNQNDIVINLSKNFRSRKGIIDGTNFIFKKLMSTEFGGIEYDENVQLNLGRKQLNFDNDYITFLLLCDLKKENNEIEESDIENFEKESKYRIEARVIANEINKIVNGSEPLLVEDDGIMRNVNYSDITILLRSFSHIDEYVEELKKHLIPAIAINKTDYFYEIEVKTMLAFLSIIDNRTIDIDLVAVLTSEIYDITPEELLKIKNNKNDYFYYNILEYIEKNTNELSDRLTRFVTDLEHWQKISAEKSISELLWDIFNETNYLSLINFSKKGDKATLNLMILLEKAKDFENNNNKGLFNFLNYIKQSVKSKIRVDGALSESEANAVNLVTIHKSKGLEYKVVFLASQGSSFNFGDEKEELVLDDTFGIGFKYFNYEYRIKNDSIFREIIKNKMRIESLEEEARLLYVGMTRATDKLYITGYPDFSKSKIIDYNEICENKDKQLVPFYKNAKCYFDFIMPTVIKHKDFKNLREEIIEYDTLEEDEGTTFSVQLIDIKEFKPTEIFENIDITENVNIVDNLDFNTLYVSNKIKKEPINITISEIKKMKIKDSFDRYYKKPNFLNTNSVQKYSGAQRGTVIHKFLENIDFTKNYNKDQLKEIALKLVEKEIFIEEELKILNFDKIISFLNSDLYNRIKNSKKVFTEKEFALFIDKKFIFDNTEDDGKYLVHGVIDLYFFEEDYIILVDYKTDTFNKDTEKKLLEEYKLQLSIYKEAIEKAEKKKVKSSYVYSFSIGDTLTIL